MVQGIGIIRNQSFPHSGCHIRVLLRLARRIGRTGPVTSSGTRRASAMPKSCERGFHMRTQELSPRSRIKRSRIKQVKVQHELTIRASNA